ncbi:MAG: hypothetical protein WD098_08870 [Balneolales bacterium]
MIGLPKLNRLITNNLLLVLFLIGLTACNSQHKPSLWLTQAEIDALPTEGESYEHVVNIANLVPLDTVSNAEGLLYRPSLTPNISHQDNDHNNQTYAAALLCARGVDQKYCDQAEKGLKDAIGTEEGGRSLALSRNLLAYVLAADIIGYRDPEFMNWLDEVRYKELQGRSLISTHDDRPNNWGTHAGASRLAASAYIGDTEDVEAAIQVFRGWLGDRKAYAAFRFGSTENNLNWQADPRSPVGINPAGATKDGHNIDGVFPEEMRRCGDGSFRWPPCKTGYTWEALQGTMMQAELINRMGYPAWDWESKAILRAVTWLHETTFDDGGHDLPLGDDRWQPWLVNYAYGTDFPAERATEPGKNMGFTDWTHGDRTRQKD